MKIHEIDENNFDVYVMPETVMLNYLREHFLGAVDKELRIRIRDRVSTVSHCPAELPSDRDDEVVEGGVGTFDAESVIRVGNLESALSTIWLHQEVAGAAVAHGKIAALLALQIGMAEDKEY